MKLVWLLEPDDRIQPGDQIAIDETGGAPNLDLGMVAPGLTHDSTAGHYIVIRPAEPCEIETQEKIS